MRRYEGWLKVLMILVTLALQNLGTAADWPTWQHDTRRSGFSPESIDSSRLHVEWCWQSAFPPEPAWHGPAKWDAYAKIRDLPSMRSYDLVFQPVMARGRVYLGSSSDDTVYCLDVNAKKVAWKYTTDGPIRIAPTIADGRVFVGSDDGFAYCLDAITGKLVWRFRPDDGLQQKQKKILNNGRFIPSAPCRTGVLVDGQTAWFGCGLLPWKPSYLCAVDIQTGQPEGAGHFVKKLSGKTLEGAPALSSKLVLFPQGRVAPQVFARTDGKDLGQFKKSGGGSLVVVSLDKKIFHGPATDSRKGGIAASDPEKLEMVAGYGRGNALIVNERNSFLLNGDELVATDLATGKNVFRVSSRGQLALIGAGGTLFAGGEDLVEAFRASDGDRVWSHAVTGKAYGMAVSDGRLTVSTDAGHVYVFHAGDSSGNSGAEPQAASVAAAASGGRLDSSERPAAVKDEHLLGRWVFQSSLVEGKTVEDLTGNSAAELAVSKQFEQVGTRQALFLDGSRQSALISPSFRQARVPKRTISATAWVRVDAPQTWGGIIGAIQDNGEFERGWVLGIRGSKFSFALAGIDGGNRLTYMTAATDFGNRQWHHVAATYDGQTMKLFVDGQLSSTSTAQSGDIRYPPQAFYEIGAYHDNDEYFRLAGAIHEVRVYDDVLSAEEVRAQYRELAAGFPQPKEIHQLALGPWLEFTKPDEARIRWETADPSPTILELTRSGKILDTETVRGLQVHAESEPVPGVPGPDTRRVLEMTDLKRIHGVVLSGLKRNRIYHYTIRALQNGQMVETARVECDTFFNYTARASGSRESSGETSDKSAGVSSVAAPILEQIDIDRGLCLVAGLHDGALAAALAQSTRMRIVCVDTSPERVARVRQALMERSDGQGSLYGGRVTAHLVDDLNDLPFVGHFANLVVSERMHLQETVPGRREVLRVLRPDGGTAVLGSDRVLPADRLAFESSLRKWITTGDSGSVHNEDGVWLVLKRGPMADSGEWSHLYGTPDNSAFAGETLGGAKAASDFDVQWIGRPGPRYQSDRSGRKPSPLATGGRLFLQGLDRIVAADSYNGEILWSLEIPGFRRFNVPRDSSNWCADRDFVYAVVRDRVWQIEARTGQVQQFLKADDIQGRDWKSDWSFVARTGDHLIGTSVKAGSAWTDFFGKEGWYDARSGPQAAQVCSDRIFAKSVEDGSTIWSKQSEGVVLNSTITIADGKIYFVECRHPDVVSADERRVFKSELWKQQYLVAVDALTGSKLWEKPTDTVDGVAAFYLAHAQGQLIAVSSNEKNYHVYSFSGDGGDQQWKQTFGWLEGKGDHGKAMSRPAIVGDRLFVRPRVLSLGDGRLRDQKMPGGGCGTYACSTNALFFRSGEVTVWDSQAGRTTKWSRLRPDCWLSTIPAGGMLLSPEGGGGCSCGKWLETSIGFMPTARRQ